MTTQVYTSNIERYRTCLDCEHFEEEHPFTHKSTHPYCKMLGDFVTCVLAGEDLLPLRPPRCRDRMLKRGSMPWIERI